MNKLTKSFLMGLALCGASMSAIADSKKIALDVNQDGVSDFELHANFANLGSAKGCKLLVHGSGADSTYFSKISKYWSYRGDTVISYDLPGHGQSKTLNWSFANQGSIDPLKTSLNAVISEFNVKGCTLVAWSLGGNLALQSYADGQINGIDNLVIVGAGPLDFTAQYPNHFSPESCAVNAITSAYNLVETTRNQSLELNQTYFRDCKAPAKHATSTLALESGFKSGIIASLYGGQLVDGLGVAANLDTPTLLLYGTSDAWFTTDYAQFLDATFKNSTLKLVDSGHAVLTERPRKSVKLIDNWLKTLN